MLGTGGDPGGWPEPGGTCPDSGAVPWVWPLEPPLRLLTGMCSELVTDIVGASPLASYIGKKTTIVMHNYHSYLLGDYHMHISKDQ